MIAPPYRNVTAVSILWNESDRVAPLVSTLGTWFESVVIVVQKSDDDTLIQCQRILNSPTHHVVEDEWRGAGDFSMPLALDRVITPWVIVISGDEFPDIELLRSLPDATAALESDGLDGAFINFTETIDGIPYTEHGRHVRLFRPEGGWEARLHSAASHENVGIWPIGVIHHERSLTEVIDDYLGYLTIAEKDGDANLINVNRATIIRACETVASVRGWEHVRSLPDWPLVERRVFKYLTTGMEII